MIKRREVGDRTRAPRKKRACEEGPEEEKGRLQLFFGFTP